MKFLKLKNLSKSADNNYNYPKPNSNILLNQDFSENDFDMKEFVIKSPKIQSTKLDLIINTLMKGKVKFS